VDFLAQTTCETAGGVCEWVARETGNTWLGRVVAGVVAPLGEATAIVVVTALLAFVLRRVVRRVARRLADPRHGGRLTAIAPGGKAAFLDPRRERRVESLAQVIVSITTAVIWTLGIMIALGAFDINLGPLIASAGIVGVALGFGAQSLVKDFLSGLFMLAEDQFGVGDVIDVGEAAGVVESLSLRTTSLRSVDGTLWHVPNGEIMRVGNMSQDWARAVLDIGVAYDASVDRAREVITSVASAMVDDPDYDHVILEEPDIQGVQDLSADAVVIRMSIKTLPGQQWVVARELRRRIKLALDDADIAIPFPQRQLWIRSDGGVFGDRGPGSDDGSGDGGSGGEGPRSGSGSTASTTPDADPGVDAVGAQGDGAAGESGDDAGERG